MERLAREGEELDDGCRPRLSALSELLRRARSIYRGGCLELTETFPVFQHSALVDVSHLREQAYYYPDAAGEPQLRQAIADHLTRDLAMPRVEPASILVTQGASHAIFTIAQTFQHRLPALSFPIPSFAGYRQVAKSLRIPLMEYPAPDGQWNPRSAFSRHPTGALVFVNSPHNPTGYVLNIEQIREIFLVAAEHKFLLVFDVVYDAFIFQTALGAAAPYVVAQEFPNVPAFFVNSLSKNTGRPGLRIGWIVAPSESIAMFEVGVEASVNCLSPVTQAIAKELLLHWPRAKCLEVMRARLGRMIHQLGDSPQLQFQVPLGGTMLWVKSEEATVVSLLNWLLEEHAVLLLPGSAYSGGSDEYFRLSYGYPEEEIDLVCARIRDFFSR
ncbi:MAG: pyridoxal phosphate-dependent aminotransferase [Pseudomonadota bacterium]|nr:pyridoxal phosphate-dependent aminotransferase [Pseudomonadota bacterium]